MLELLCQARNFNSARNFLLSILGKSNGAIQLEDKHFNCLICAFGEAGLFKESQKIFKTMKSIGVSPSVIMFNASGDHLCSKKMVTVIGCWSFLLIANSFLR